MERTDSRSRYNVQQVQWVEGFSRFRCKGVPVPGAAQVDLGPATQHGVVGVVEDRDGLARLRLERHGVQELAPPLARLARRLGLLREPGAVVWLSGYGEERVWLRARVKQARPLSPRDSAGRALFRCALGNRSGLMIE